MTTSPPLDLTHDLFQIMKRLPRLRLRDRSYEVLKGREADLLVMLAINLDADTPALRVTALSDLLKITPAGVTHLLNPLETLGYIERLPDPNDRRVVLIGLTQEGDAMAQDLIAEVQEKLSGLVKYLGEEDSRTLIRLMSKVIAFFSAQSQQHEI
jgi:DNA-binding MarR family transcriptional regulator